MSQLEENLRSVQQRIAAAAVRVGRQPSEITLVAVTKTQPPEAILEAYELGLRHFGENRADEAETKVSRLPTDVVWHMIGHVQSRKASRVASLFQIVHSIDTLKLARRLEMNATVQQNPLPVFLEFNVSGEPSKNGFPAYEWYPGGALAEQVIAEIGEIVCLSGLKVLGVMTVAPIVSNPEAARPVFVRLRQLGEFLGQSFPQVDWSHLSMGMTDDFEVAIEEGATHVRVGRAIFAPTMPAWRKS